jgi:hypothetical protein
MHMWKETQERRIIRQGTPSFNPIVVGSGRNEEMIVRQLQRQDSLRWNVLSKNETDGCLITNTVTVGRVMHLEDQVGSSRNELRHSDRPVIR